MYVVTKHARFIAIAEARQIDEYFAPFAERGIAGNAGIIVGSRAAKAVDKHHRKAISREIVPAQRGASDGRIKTVHLYASMIRLLFFYTVTLSFVLPLSAV